MKDKIRINFWNYHPMKSQTAKDVAEWKKMGFTSVMTGEGRFNKEGVAEKITETLKACEDENFSALLYDWTFQTEYYRCVGEEKYREGVKKAVAFYEQFSAAKYALVTDEPLTKEDWQEIYAAWRIIREESKQIKPICAVHRAGKSKKEVWAQLEEYYENCQPEILLFNCYSQCFDEVENQEQGLENFFYTLNIYSAFAQSKDIDLALSLICCGHWCFRSPTQDDIRWQLNVAAAHGVKGMHWFHPFELSKPNQYNNFREFPVDRFGDHTATYHPLCYENKQFMDTMERYGLVDGAKLEKVYHVFRSYGGYAYFEKDEDEYVKDIINPFNRPLILSRFIRKDGMRVIMVVNNAQRGFASIEVVFNEALGMKNEKADLAAGSALLVELK